MSDEAAGNEVPGMSAEVYYWKNEIEMYERDSQAWERRGDKVIKRYKDERDANDKKFRFNLLWSNVQTLTPALFAKNPKVNVERRFQEDDPVGRVASTVLERAISYFVDEKFYDAVKQAVQDRLLPGRGTVGIRYKLSNAKSTEITDDVDDEQQTKQEAYTEEICIDYLHWKDFGHTFGRTWEEIRAPWKKAYMGREELVARFDDVGKLIPLDYTPTKGAKSATSENVKKATIYEIWDKQNKRFIWLHKDYPQLLDEEADPLRLKEFFPCPRPLFGTTGNDTIIPVPDYAEYQDQAQELDDLTARIHNITKTIKLVGAYDGSADGLQRMLAEGMDNQLVPVSNWAMFAEKGGLDGAVSWLPLEQVIKALEGLHAAREKVKHDLYEISGMSDIIRGEGDSGETATGVKTKGQFATLRLNAMQAEVSRFCRDAVRIMGEIISTHFKLDTIRNISGVQLLYEKEKALIAAYQQQMQQAAQAQQTPPPGQPQPVSSPAAPIQLPPNLAKLLNDQDRLEELMDEPTWEDVHALLTNDTLRCFRIDIEVDSTIKADQEAERQARVEFLEAAGQFIQQAVTIPNPELAPLLMHMLMFGVRGFHVGKELEASFNVALKKLQKAAQNPPQQASDPELQKVQAQGQIDAALEQMKHQNALQIKQAELQHTQALAQKDAQLEAAKAQADSQVEAMKLAHDREIEDMKARHEQTAIMINRDLEQMKMRHEIQLEGMKQAHELALKDKDHAHEREIKAAEIKSKENQARKEAK